MSRLAATFRSLSVRNYRLYLAGQAVSVAGTWMQKLAQAWLVLDLTGSGVLLGVTAALQHLPTLLGGPWGGLLADRADKRRILLWTKSIAGVLALVLGVLTLTGHIRLWMVFLLAVALGITQAAERPARHTFVLEMVGPAHLTNAVTLNSVVMNVGMAVGPAVAGVLIAYFGVAVSFLLNALSFGAVLAGLLLMRTDELHPAPVAARARAQIREGLRYVGRTPELLGPIALMTVAGTLAFEWQVVFPLLARDVFGDDAQVLGLLFSAMGIGAVLGGLAAASSLRASALALITTAWVFSTLAVMVAAAPTLVVALLALVGLGGASIAFRALATSLVQLVSEPQLRGRAVALLTMAMLGTTPIGGPLVGWLGEAFGARFAMAIGGIATALAALGTWWYLRRSGAPLRHHPDLVTAPEVASERASPATG